MVFRQHNNIFFLRNLSKCVKYIYFFYTTNKLEDVILDAIQKSVYKVKDNIDINISLTLRHSIFKDNNIRNMNLSVFLIILLNIYITQNRNFLKRKLLFFPLFSTCYIFVELYDTITIVDINGYISNLFIEFRLCLKHILLDQSKSLNLR